MRRWPAHPQIDVCNEAQVQYWAELWRVPAFEIRRAVDRAGPALAEVEKALRAARPRPAGIADPGAGMPAPGGTPQGP